MGRLEPRWIVLLAAILLLAGAYTAPQSFLRAQEAETELPVTGSEPIQQNLFQAILEDLPAAPAFVRIVRITLQPGASVPMHTHPGPEFGRVENGVLTVRVEGDVVIAQATVGGTPQAPRVPPVGQEFDLYPGDQIVYPAEVPLSFSNRSQDPVSIMTAVILPAGSGRPPSSEWVEGTPGPDAMVGVTSEILGDAVAPGWPAAPFAVVLDRLVLAPGESIPARGGPVLLSVEIGRFGFALVDGQFQLSRGNSGPLAVATPGVPYILSPGDAVFFPGGMNEVPRQESDGVLVLLRLSILNAGGPVPEQTPAPAEEGAESQPEEVQAAEAEGEESEPSDAEGEPTEVPEPAAEAEPAPAGEGLGPGAAALVTENGVRLRDSPSTNGEVVAELNAGRGVVVTGEAVEGDGILWYPIAAADDEAIAGFVAEDFLSPSP